MLTYVVHDLADPAVERRLRQFEMGGIDRVEVAGFEKVGRRSPGVVVEGARRLGRTRDGKLVQRIVAGLLGALKLATARNAMTSDRVVARNLECLFVVVLASWLTRHRPRIAYEVLDIHDAMASWSKKSNLLRLGERLLLRRVSVVLISSVAYREQYFDRFHPGLDVEFHVVENKVLADEVPARPPAPTPRSSNRLRIGWFGSLRCRVSARLLEDMVRSDQNIEVVARGRPLDDIRERLERCAEELPNFSFAGPYDRRFDLERIYSDVDVVWVVDFYESEFNSKWLLPNRLYEGLALGVPPVAHADTETGRWLSQRVAGVQLEDDDLRDLGARMASVRLEITSLTAKAHSVPREDVVCDLDECQRIARAIAGIGIPTVRSRVVAAPATRARQRGGA